MLSPFVIDSHCYCTIAPVSAKSGGTDSSSRRLKKSLHSASL